MENLAISHLHGPRGVTEKIKQAMYESAKQFVYIGFLLWEVQEYKYYEEGGYDSVYSYAEYELGFKRSSTKNFIAISKTFGVQEDKFYGPLRMSCIQPEYKDFKYSQLVELLGMSEPQRQQVTPDMTVKQLRELKKQPPIIQQLVLGEEISLNEKIGQTSGQKEPMSAVVNNAWKDMDPEIVKAIVKASGIRWNPKSCYNIKIELHRG